MASNMALRLTNLCSSRSDCGERHASPPTHRPVHQPLRHSEMHSSAMDGSSPSHLTANEPKSEVTLLQ